MTARMTKQYLVELERDLAAARAQIAAALAICDKWDRKYAPDGFREASVIIRHALTWETP